MFLLFSLGCCGAVDISKNSIEVSAANESSTVVVADGTVVAAKQASPVPPLQSMNLETSDTVGKTSDDKPLPLPGPHFVPEASKNVTALAGRVASLNCRIKNLDNWTVGETLTRFGDCRFHLLTCHGRSATLITEQRFFFSIQCRLNVSTPAPVT